MVKKKRKSKIVDSSLFHLTGTDGDSGEADLLEGCLAELEEPKATSSVHKKTDVGLSGDVDALIHPQEGRHDNDNDNNINNDNNIPLKKRKFASPNVATASDDRKGQSGEQSWSDDLLFWDSTVRFRPSTTTQRNFLTNRIKRWNQDLQEWIKTGNYPMYDDPPLLPSFEMELNRHFAVERLSTHLLEEGKVKMPVFERWLLDVKQEQQQASSHADLRKNNDPILTSVRDVSESAACQRLVVELMAGSSNMSKDSATAIVKELCRLTTTAIHELASQSNRISRCPLKKGDRLVREERSLSEGQEDQIVVLTYSRKSWKKPFCIKINATHYGKLQQMFETVHSLKLSSSKDNKKKMERAFQLIVMSLILRYSALSGGHLLNDLRGGGMQGAVPSSLFPTLATIYGGTTATPFFECFASPVNSYFSSFCSAFSEEYDWHFGSYGDFFKSNLLESKKKYIRLEANPPFSPGFMMKMTDRFQEMMEQANDNGLDLAICVIVPSVANEQRKDRAKAKQFASPSFVKLKSMAKHHVLLKAREHGYIEGAQHLRPTRHKESPYDTSVFLLESHACSTKWTESMDPVSIANRIRDAFKSWHKMEVRERKQRAKK